MNKIAVFCLLGSLVAGCTSNTSPAEPSAAVTEIQKQLDSSTPKALEESPTTDESASAEQSAEEIAEGWGNLRGRFVFGGDPPQPVKLVVTKDLQVCGKGDLFNESLVVHPENKGIRNVVVQLYLKRNDKRPPIHDSYAAAANSVVQLDNVLCRFDGHVVGVQTSQTLLIRNLDAVGHNTKIDALSNTAINPILAANSQLEHQFTKPERAPVPVSCSIHPWMSGHLLVVDHPYFCITDENGEFEIANLPAGDWSFSAWHEKSRYITDVTVDGAEVTWGRGRFDQPIRNETTTDMGEIVIAAEKFE